MSFIYDSLPQGSYIRLLKVITNPHRHKLLCEFQIAALKDCHHKYTALSYAWEDPAPVSALYFVDGQVFPISRTLTNLFDTLRKQLADFTLWIDAICINQADNDEKAIQVQQMGQVYSRAEQVLLWLGASTIETQKAFQYMASKQTLSWPEDWHEESDFSELAYLLPLLKRPWFRRVWVIQEATLNDNVLVACGDDTLDFDNLQLCIFAFWKYFEGWSDYEVDDPAILGLKALTKLISIRDIFQDAGPVRYENLLETAFQFEATDKRDMIFAFRGIAYQARPVPEPDYTAAVEDVYTQTAIALLCHGGSLDVLALCGTALERASSLPSWAVDLRHKSYTEPFVPCDRAEWNAGGAFISPPTLVSTNQLSISVRLIGTVDVVCSPFQSYWVEAQQIAISEILALRERLQPEVSLGRWLDVMAESFIYGLNIDDEPVGSEYDDDFIEWIQWLQSSTSQDDLNAITHNRYHRTCGLRVDNWNAFMTKEGYFGIGPPDTSVGDRICIIPGCRLPLILRPVEKGSDFEPAVVSSLVSGCFVHDVMHGELANSDLATEEILVL